MYKFAHFTDCHLGAWRNPKLRDLNLKAFEQAISKCIAESVNFIVITGDFFDTNIPDLVPVKRAVEILKNAKDKGIAIYIIYGSHDFSSNTVSMIDILHSAGLFTKPVKMEQVDNKLRLQFLSDAATGAKITGLSGRKGILDRNNYEMLDTSNLESEDSFKIFFFHAPMTEATTPP
jgi:DNA repair exonuclease SbcCD nuclease subunit